MTNDVAPPTDAPPPAARPSLPGPVARLVAAGRRLPFTALAFLTILVLGIVTGGLWSRLENRSWYIDIAYGVPSFEVGHFWTPLTAPLFASSSLAYVGILIFFALLVGLAEWRIGTARAALVTCVVQVLASLAAIAVVWGLAQTTWPWAQVTAEQLDVGFTAGAVGALAVASVTLHPPWRFRTQIGLCVFVGVMFLYVGALNDVARLLAVIIALPIARWIVGPARVAPRSRPSKREWRLTAVAGIAVITLIALVALMWPGESPLGPTGSDDPTFLSVAIPLLILLVLGLRTASRQAARVVDHGDHRVRDRPVRDLHLGARAGRGHLRPGLRARWRGRVHRGRDALRRAVGAVDRRSARLPRAEPAENPQADRAVGSGTRVGTPARQRRRHDLVDDDLAREPSFRARRRRWLRGISAARRSGDRARRSGRAGGRSGRDRPRVRADV